MMFKQYKKIKYIMTIFVLFIGLAINILIAEEAGWKLINQAIKDYEDSKFYSAIDLLQRAFNDPTLTPQDSTLAYPYLAASYLQIGNSHSGCLYIKKMILRKPNDPLHDVLREFQKVCDSVIRELYCNIKIKSNPQNALININGNYQGVTDTVIKLFKESMYTITISMYEYNPVTINQTFSRDTALIITLEKTRYIPPKPMPIPGPPFTIRPALPYIFGITSSIVLPLISFETSIYFDNKMKENIKQHSIALNETAQKKAENSIKQDRSWGKRFYYGSYALIASGVIVGYFTQKVIERYEWYSSNNTKIYCAFDENLKPSINIRRNIW